MINVFVGSKKITLRWYENGELQKKTVGKRMIIGEENNNDGIIKKDIYSGKEYGISTIPGRFQLPKLPIPFPVYDYYDYSAGAKLQYFKDINPEAPRAVFFDIETTSLDYATGVITSICWIDSYTGKEYESLNEGNEEDCLYGFVEYLKDHNILSIIGFNSNKFDIPYLEGRCLYNNIHFEPRRYIKQDVMTIANKLFYFGSLDVIAQKLGVERKLETDNPIKLWNERRYDELLEYNAQDVRVTKQIYEKLNMKEFLEALWELTWFDYDRVGANSHISNMFYNKRMWEDGYCVTKVDNEYKGDFGGGFNFNTHGTFDNVYVYDFASLYPNIIRGLKLSPENYCEDDINYSADRNFNLVLKKDAFQDVEPGLLDKYMTELLELRKQYKAEGKDHEQNACKILANSVYGILSQKTAKFVLGGTHLASTVTWTGRNMLQTVSRLIAREGIETIYGKTDSIFIKSPFDIAQTSEIMQECVDSAWKSITGTDNTTLSMDFEGLYEKLWIINKNNYAYIKKGKVYVKGPSFKNKKNSQFEKDVTNRILEMILIEGYQYRIDIFEALKYYTDLQRATMPISYFAIKHKARREKINIWDTGTVFMEYEDLGEPDYGFYHHVAKVETFPPNQPFEVIMFPLNYEPQNGYRVQRKWIDSQIQKILKKLNVPEKKKQINLDAFLNA